MPKINAIHEAVARIFLDYWPDDTPGYVLDAEIGRTAENVRQVVNRVGTQATIADIGGGWGTFAASCAALGMTVTLIDDFRDRGFYERADKRYRMQQDFDLSIISRDVACEGLSDLPADSFDAVTSFDSIEHWHASPKRALHHAVTALKPGALLLLAAPNCVRLRRRISIVFGRDRWSEMAEWYEQPVFRSHVREPSLVDLRYIARDLGLEHVETFGRNWQGYEHPNANVRRLVKLIDPILRTRTALCSDIYLAGRKAANHT